MKYPPLSPGAILLWFCVLVSLCRADLVWERTEGALAIDATSNIDRLTFRFRNAGSQSVSITSVRTSCDCTSAIADKSVYQPGESGVIEAIFDLSKRSGTYDEAIMVATDEPSRHVATLKVHVAGARVINIVPRAVFWAKGAHPAEQKITVEAGVANALAITKADCDNDNFVVRTDCSQNRYCIYVLPKATGTIVQGTIRITAILNSQRRVYVAYAAVK